VGRRWKKLCPAERGPKGQNKENQISEKEKKTNQTSAQSLRAGERGPEKVVELSMYADFVATCMVWTPTWSVPPAKLEGRFGKRRVKMVIIADTLSATRKGMTRFI